MYQKVFLFILFIQNQINKKMKKYLIPIVICSFLKIFTNSQATEVAETKINNTICEITNYAAACHTDKRCAFVESQKDSYKYFACLEVSAKDCNFFCNYFNELNTSGGITSKDCVCNGIKYPQ